jgi:hypothetical protein
MKILLFILALFVLVLIAVGLTTGIIHKPNSDQTAVLPFGAYLQPAPSNAQGQGTVDDRIQVVGRRCLNLDSNTPVHYSDREFQPSIPALETYRLLRFWPEGIASKSCLLAVGTDGTVLQMPAEFNEIIRRSRFTISGESDAVKLATTYATLTTAIGKIVVLSAPDTIPGFSTNPPRNPLGISIVPPTVRSLDSKYSVVLFTWKELGGVVEKWFITISQTSQLEVQKQVIATHVGNAVGLQ